MSSSKSRRFVFTLNNPTDDEEQQVCDFLDSPQCVYGIVGRERGEQGTPHLQGFLILPAPQRFSFLHRKLSPRLHLEVARAKSTQAAEYCKKEGNFDEFGSLPDQQGRRTDIEDFKVWVVEQSTRPSERDIARAFPSLFLRYRTNLLDLAQHLRPPPVIGGGEPRQWQLDLGEHLEEVPDDRSVEFYVDPEGGKGKSWFVRYWLTKHPDITQVLSIGKRDDLAYAIDETKSVFIFDVPRGGMEYLQYPVLEKLKDQIIFSAKYQSTTKFFESPVHVIVFCNEHPDLEKMTEDRYIVHEL